MANSQSQPQPSRSRLSHLRAVAQSHLSEIESEKAREQAQLTQAEAEIQRYSKMSSYDRKKLAGSNDTRPLPRSESNPDNEQYASASTTYQTSSPTATTPSPQKKRFRPFPEILHRLQWDPTLEISEYIVGYLERFEGIKEMPASNWVRDFSEEEWIPMHRVRYVKRVDGKSGGGPQLGVVWDRDGRVDLFAAGAGEAGEEGEEKKREWEGDVSSLDGMSVGGGVRI